jgi:hypothetical protein
MQSVSSNAVAKALEQIYVGTSVLWHNPNGYTMNRNTTTNILGAYNYQLFDGFPTAPSGWHKEFILTAQGYSTSATGIRARLNNIGTGYIKTWSPSSFRIIACSNRFKTSDIVLEPTMGFTNNGTNLKFQTSNDDSGTATIFSVSITCFYVKD